VLRPNKLRQAMAYAVLYVVRELGEATGYEVSRRIGELTENVYKPSPGVVYPILRTLEHRGLVESVLSEGKTKYRLTKLGEEFMEKHAREFESFLELLRAEKCSGKFRVFSELKKLFRTVLLYHDELDEATSAKVSEILEESRKRILGVLEGRERD